MSKIEAGKFELSEEIFDLKEAAEACVRFVKPACRSRRRRGPDRGRAAGATIFADKRAIKQILVNLVVNGVKFTPRGGEVRVHGRARQPGHRNRRVGFRRRHFRTRS